MRVTAQARRAYQDLDREQAGISFGRSGTMTTMTRQRITSLKDHMAAGVRQFNQEYGNSYISTDDEKLLCKVCRVVYAPENTERSHHHFHPTSDTIHLILEGEGEYLVEEGRWVPVKPGDLIYNKAGEVHGVRATAPGDEVWYLAIEGPIPVLVETLDKGLHGFVLAGPPR
jgi:quercetin dioxygenase-like cupin family protein